MNIFKKIAAVALAVAVMPVSAQAAEWAHVKIADGAMISESVNTEYPATLTRGAQQADAAALLASLPGGGWTKQERNEYSDSDEYRSEGGSEPWEYKHVTVYDADGEFWYYDPMVLGERGAEYEPQPMNMLPGESISALKALLSGVVPDEWLAVPDAAAAARNRWNDSAGRWFTESEYADKYMNAAGHAFVFAQTSAAGITVLGENVYAQLGVNGLASLEINRHDWAEADETVAPMPFEQAVTLADSTREVDCTLYYAGLVYSNWLTESDVYDLSWYLVTAEGRYVVDCVTGEHKCDMYEY